MIVENGLVTCLRVVKKYCNFPHGLQTKRIINIYVYHVNLKTNKCKYTAQFKYKCTITASPIVFNVEPSTFL